MTKQENEWLQDPACGCGASSDGNAIWLCPLHRAAPELLEALEDLLNAAPGDNERETRAARAVIENARALDEGEV